jgi:hypothetical protein
MNDSLFNIFQTAPELPAPADLLSRVHKEIIFRKIKRIVTFSTVVLFVSFLASLWYLYANIIELDSITITKLAFSTLELDVDSITESFSFLIGSLPLFAFAIFVANTVALTGIFYINRHMQILRKGRPFGLPGNFI